MNDRSTNILCPKCEGAKLKTNIAYVMGHKSSDGYECPNCDFWCFFGDIDKEKHKITNHP
jgi:predicted RNA-binding Zn-ribbon protein involved in translation (DUF1610 family)